MSIIYKQQHNKATFILLLNILSKSYLKLHFVTHLYFGRDSVHCVITVVFLLAAYLLDEFEEGDPWDRQTGNSSQDEDDDVDPGRIMTRIKGGEILLWPKEGVKENVTIYSYAQHTRGLL